MSTCDCHLPAACVPPGGPRADHAEAVWISPWGLTWPGSLFIPAESRCRQTLLPRPQVSLAVPGLLPGCLGCLPTRTWGGVLARWRRVRGVTTLLPAPAHPPDCGQRGHGPAPPLPRAPAVGRPGRGGHVGLSGAGWIGRGVEARPSHTSDEPLRRHPTASAVLSACFHARLTESPAQQVRCGHRRERSRGTPAVSPGRTTAKTVTDRWSRPACFH